MGDHVFEAVVLGLWIWSGAMAMANAIDNHADMCAPAAQESDR